MWLFLVFGYFSVVQSKTNADVLVVRARVRGDLDRLRAEFAPSLSESVRSYGRDYQYRGEISREAWGEAMRLIGLAVTAQNFKSEVAKLNAPTEHARESRYNVYSRVWSVMTSLNKLPPYADERPFTAPDLKVRKPVNAPPRAPWREILKDAGLPTPGKRGNPRKPKPAE